MTELVASPADKTNALNANSDEREFVSVRVGAQLFGIPVLQVQDVLKGQRHYNIPLSERYIAGAMNLRGRIVTAIDMHVRLDIAKPETRDEKANMSVVVEQKNELYSLEVDVVGEVLAVPSARVERNTSTLDAQWRDIAAAVIKLKDELMVVLDVSKLLRL